MDAEQLQRELEADFDIKTLQDFVSDPILDFLLMNDDAGDAIATPLSSELPFEPSPASTAVAAPFLANPIYSSPARTACGDPYEHNSKRPRVEPSKATKSRAFAPPMTKKEVEQARTGAIPKQTRDDMAYCVRIWDEWRYHRQVNYGDPIPEICQVDLHSS